jgi:hypothetical protein
MNDLLMGNADLSQPQPSKPLNPQSHREADAFVQSCLKKVSTDLPKGVPGKLVTQQLAAQVAIERLHNKWKLAAQKGDTTPYPYKEVLLQERRFTDSLESFLDKAPGYRHLYNQISQEG